MKTGDFSPYEKPKPNRLELKDRRHGGGLGEDCNNDYGLAPPSNKTIVGYMTERAKARAKGHRPVGSIQIKDTQKVSKKASVRHDSKDTGSFKPSKTETKVRKSKSQETFGAKNGQSNKNKADEEKDIIHTKNDALGPRDAEINMRDLLVSRARTSANLARSRLTKESLANEQRKEGHKAVTTGNPSAKNSTKMTNGTLKIPTENDYIDTDISDDDTRMWSADDSSVSDEEITSLTKPRHGLNSGLLSNSAKIRSKSQPRKLSIDDFSKDIKQPSTLLYKRRQRHRPHFHEEHGASFGYSGDSPYNNLRNRAVNVPQHRIVPGMDFSNDKLHPSKSHNALTKPLRQSSGGHEIGGFRQHGRLNSRHSRQGPHPPQLPLISAPPGSSTNKTPKQVKRELAAEFRGKEDFAVVVKELR